MLRFALPTLLASAILCAAPSARATVAIPMAFAQLTKEAHVVVHGVVLASRSFWGPKRERIYTHTTVSVWRALKGRTASRTITVRQWGGEAEGYRMEIPGNATLRPGEEVVLFLTRDGAHHFVVGLAQGKVTLKADAGGRKLARRELGGLTFARWSPSGRMYLAPRSGKERPITLDALEAEVKRATEARR